MQTKGHLQSNDVNFRFYVSLLSLPWGLWAAGGEAQPQFVRSYQDPFPEGQEAVTHTAQNISHKRLIYRSTTD